MNDIVASAVLNNGKRIILEPKDNYVLWREATEYENKNHVFQTDKVYIWRQAQIMTELDKGVRMIYVVIEGTPIMLNRYFE